MRAFLQRSDLGLRRLLSIRRAALRCRSLYSGTSYRTLKLRHVIGVRLDQVLIVERGSHRILDEWSGGSKGRMEEEKAAPRKATAMMLAAIGAFAKDPKSVFHGGISSLDLGRTHVQLYATPTYVLGARYGGPALGKLDQHIDAALRNALRATPELLHWIGGAPEDLKGTAGKIASTLEKLLLDANLPPHGEVQRPIFAYATIAGLCLASITATGDAIMRQTVAPKKESADDLQHVVMGIAASTKGVTLSELRVDVAAGGDAVRLSGLVESPSAGNALNKSIKSALGNVTVTSHFLFAQPSDLLTAQLNRSLLQFSLAGMGRTPLTPDDVDGTVETAVANLGNFDWGAATKMGAFKRFDLTSPSPKLDLQRKDLASGLLQGVPVSVTDQGVRVGLFSIGSDGGSLFSSSASGVTSGMTTNAGSGVEAGTNGFGTGATTQTVAQPLNTVTSTVRGLPR